jgi:hypothetical protein
MVSGWFGRIWWRGAGEGALRAGAVASAIGAAAFIFNIWRTLDAAAKPRGAAQRIIVR